jgi:hypothetical protein
MAIIGQEKYFILPKKRIFFQGQEGESSIANK